MEVFFTVVGLGIAIAVVVALGQSRKDVENAQDALSNALKQSGISEGDVPTFRFVCRALSSRRERGHITSSKNFGFSQVLVYDHSILVAALGSWRRIKIDSIVDVSFLIPETPDVPQIINLNSAAILANALARVEAAKIKPNYGIEFQVSLDTYDDVIFKLDSFQANFDPQVVAEFIHKRLVTRTHT